MFLKKIAADSFLLYVHVKPNSKKQDIINNGDYLTVYIRSKAIHNKANKELLNLLKKKCKISLNQIQIVSGVRNSNKIVELNFSPNIDEEEIFKRIFI